WLNLRLLVHAQARSWERPWSRKPFACKHAPTQPVLLPWFNVRLLVLPRRTSWERPWSRKPFACKHAPTQPVLLPWLNVRLLVRAPAHLVGATLVAKALRVQARSHTQPRRSRDLRAAGDGGTIEK